jgi:hypothetical protein
VDLNLNIPVYIPPGSSSISGKIYYLEAAVSSAGNIVSYDKFGIKDSVTLYPGRNPGIYFNNEEISYNPPESQRYVSIDLPLGYDLRYSCVYLTTLNNKKSNDVCLPEKNYLSNSYHILTPVLPGKEFIYKVYAKYRSSLQNAYQSLEGSMWKKVNAGENFSLTLNNTLNEKLPANGINNVTDTTTFEIKDISGPALYEYKLTLADDNSSINLYSDKTKIKFSDFRFGRFELKHGETYIWNVRKFPNYNNIDEFLLQPFVLDNRYDYIEVTPGRSFKTAP